METGAGGAGGGGASGPGAVSGLGIMSGSGAGGTGGNGGDVTVDLSNSQGSGIATYGHFSAGVIAQSVGGGGGNGGYSDTVGFAISASISNGFKT